LKRYLDSIYDRDPVAAYVMLVPESGGLMTTPATTEPITDLPHLWTIVLLGRICRACGLIQANGEFDDSVDCPGPHSK
jgi:hypothetical protein